MHLYLSSYHLGENAQKFAKLVEGNKRIGVVTNALDFSTDTARLAQSFQREIDDLRALGLSPEILDLRTFFGKEEMLTAKIEHLDGLWVIGGNTFILRRAMQESGLDAILQKYIQNKLRPHFVYAGYSAGVCVLSPTLKGLEFADEPHSIPSGYKNQTLWEGLGILPYYIAPHYQSDHPESVLIEKTIAYFKQEMMPFITLRDGEDRIETQPQE